MKTHEHLASADTDSKRRLAHASAALLLAGLLTACGESKEEEETTCNSPRAFSNLFPADPNATKDRATWKNGIDIRTEVPADATGVVVGYRGQNAGTWKDSQLISPDRAQRIAVLLGNGDVAFSLFFTATEGSEACNNEPSTVFSEPQLMQPLIDADATLPQW
jgi:hypothetical protein